MYAKKLSVGVYGEKTTETCTTHFAEINGFNEILIEKTGEVAFRYNSQNCLCFINGDYY